MIIHPLKKKLSQEKNLCATDNNPFVKQICTKCANISIQPFLEFQVLFYVLFERKGFIIDDKKEP